MSRRYGVQCGYPAIMRFALVVSGLEKVIAELAK
jgi:hypothetical protein